MTAVDEPAAEEADLVDSRRGWAVVAAAFLSTFAVFAPAYSFGIFFEAMEESFDAGKSATALVFSIATFLYFVGGIYTGRWSDRVGPSRVVLTGAVAITAGLMLTAAVDSLWMAYFTYGLGVGIGVACGYVPMVAPIGGWFVRHRTTAMGVAVAGIGCSWLVVPPVVSALIDSHGWRTTYVILGAGVFVLLVIAAWLTAAAPGHVVEEPQPFMTIMRLPSFSLIYFSMLVGSIALFMPFVFLVDYATEQGLSDGQAAVLLQVLGATSVVGRLGLGALAGRTGVVRLYQVSFLCMALSFLIWLAAGSSFGMLVLFVIALGVSYGGFIALAPAVTAQLFGVTGLGAILGASYTAAGVGGLIGPPLGGYLIDATDGYTATIVLCLVAGLAAFAILVPVPSDRASA